MEPILHTQSKETATKQQDLFHKSIQNSKPQRGLAAILPDQKHRLARCKQPFRRHTFLMCPLHPLQVWEVMFDVREIFRLMVEMTKRHVHAAKLALKNRRATNVRAGVVLVGWPRLLHAGWMVQRLGFTVSISRSLTRVHAVFPTTLHCVASNPSVRHLIHVWYAVVHHGEPQQSTIKKFRVKSENCPSSKKKSRLKKEKKSNKEHQAVQKWRLEVSWPKKTSQRLTLRRHTNLLSTKSTEHRLHLASAPPATTRPNWDAEIYDDVEL